MGPKVYRRAGLLSLTEIPTQPAARFRPILHFMRPSHRLPLAVITLVLLAQAAATIAGLSVKLAGDGYWEDSFWPFMDYPMYSAAHGPPVQASSVALIAELPDGTELDISAEYLGLAFFAWRYQVVERLAAGPLEPEHAHLADVIEQHRVEARQRVVDQVRQNLGVTPVALRIDRRTHRITDAGLVVEDSQQHVPIPTEPSRSRNLTEPTP